MVGSTAIELRTAPATVRAGFAGDSTSATLSLRASDVRRLADSVTVLLRPRKAPLGEWSLRVEEPGVSAGTLVISSRAPRKGVPRRYTIFASDDMLGGVRDTLQRAEMALLAKKLTDAARSAVPAPTKGAGPARRTPKKVPIRAKGPARQ